MGLVIWEESLTAYITSRTWESQRHGWARFSNHLWSTTAMISATFTRSDPSTEPCRISSIWCRNQLKLVFVSCSICEFLEHNSTLEASIILISSKCAQPHIRRARMVSEVDQRWRAVQRFLRLASGKSRPDKLKSPTSPEQLASGRLWRSRRSLAVERATTGFLLSSVCISAAWPQLPQPKS